MSDYWIRIFISGFVNGLIAFTGSILVAINMVPKDGGFNEISGVVWTIAIVTGIAAAGKDWNAHISDPPKKVST